MTDKFYVARSTMIAARVLGEETMIMSASDSTLFTLDEVATVIWEAADGTTPLEEIVRKKVCTRYDVALEVAMKDARALVEQLAGHGLLLLSEGPIAQPAGLHKVNP
jgi:hypothetical protein